MVVVLIVGLAAWLSSGGIATQPNEAPDLNDPQTHSALTRVQVKHQTAISIREEIHIHGRTSPSQQTQLRAELASKIVSIAKEKGAEVKKGDLLIQLDPQDIPSRLRHAQALVTQRKLEYQAANRLKGQKLMGKSQLAEAKAQLESAKANVDSLTLQLNNASIRAPFDGIFSDRLVDVGHYVKHGDTVGTVVDFTPLKIVGQVPEKNRHKIRIEQPADIQLLSGHQLGGVVKFIASTGNKNTHTFTVEIIVPSTDQDSVASGITAQVAIAGKEVMAHLVSPALFELDAKGRLGVKVVNHQSEVIFSPIEVVKSDGTGTWVTGLDNEIDLVVVGQGFVKVGQQVEKVSTDEQRDSPDNVIEVSTNTSHSTVTN